MCHVFIIINKSNNLLIFITTTHKKKQPNTGGAEECGKHADYELSSLFAILLLFHSGFVYATVVVHKPTKLIKYDVYVLLLYINLHTDHICLCCCT